MSDGGGTQHAPGLFPVPGDGVLARHGSLILLCSLDDGQFVDLLLDLLENHAAAGGDGRRFADAVAEALESDLAPGGQDTAVLAFGATGTGLAVTISGSAWAEVTTAHGSARVEASHPGMLMRAVLRHTPTGIRGGLSTHDNGEARTDRFSRLDAGTVRAGGLSYFVPGAPGGPADPALRPASLSKPAPKAAKPPSEPAAWAELPVEQEDVAASGVPADAGLPPDARLAAEGASAPAAAAAAPDAGEPDAGAGASEPESVLPVAADQAGTASYEATSAWVPPVSAEPDAGTAAGSPQATEMWTPDWPGEDQGEAGAASAGSGQDVAAGAMHPPAGAAGTGEDAHEITIPPEPIPAEPMPPGEPFEAVLLLDAGAAGGVEVPPRGPLSLAKDVPVGVSSYVSAGPIIQGVYCKNGHFDDPEALFCAICGISMNQQTLVPRPGERPPLGVLLLDDGSVFQLDSGYVIGREPGLDASVAAGRARPLRVTDDAGIVSRVHAKVHLDGWRALVTDLGSANGTRIQLPGQADQPLVPQVPVVLATGSQVDLGGRMFRYESHRGR